MTYLKYADPNGRHGQNDNRSDATNLHHLREDPLSNCIGFEAEIGQLPSSTMGLERQQPNGSRAKNPSKRARTSSKSIVAHDDCCDAY